MSRALDKARSFYAPNLAPDESIAAIRRATAAGTGRYVAIGAIIGTLVGWLYAISVDSALLPPLVLGALAGETGGYLLAHRTARQPSGPGTIHLELVLTGRRLFTVGRYASWRRRMLREYPLDTIIAATTSRYPIGRYHRVEITTADGTTTGFIVEGMLDVPVNRVGTSG